jgi:5'-methylthioadenosine nucleosidase
MNQATTQQQINTSIRYQGPIERVAIQFAMRAEAEPLIQKFEMNLYSSVDRLLPHLLFAKKKIGNIELHLVAHGTDSRYGVERVGTENATLAAFKVIEIAQPDLIISAGTAGGFKGQQATIGDVYISSGIVFHDHRIPLGGYREYGKGNFPVVYAPKLVETLSLKSGIVSTGNSLDVQDMDLVQFRGSGAAVKDMEAAAIAQVAYDQGVPCFALKAITDLVDEPCNVGEVFLQNLSLASTALTEKLSCIIEQFAEGERLESL